MDNEKDLLIASAARLYSMGIDLEAARIGSGNWSSKAFPITPMK